MAEPLSLYIHVPFCAGKCPYCDFYSLPPAEGAVEGYMRRMQALLAQWGQRVGPRPVETVYLGGGTPSLLGAGRLSALLEEVARRFSLAPGAEITCEANPTGLEAGFFGGLRAGGFNRLSLGMQSAHPRELELLGRRHSPEDVAAAVEAARAAGFGNLSLDLMLALPGSSPESLEGSAAFAAGLGPQHISAYLLKVEPGTPFAHRRLDLPGEDEAAGQYLACVEALARLGYAQYEISNFALPGRESRHNLTYWQGREYLGLGPGAHSFWDGRRFFWERDLAGFLVGSQPVDDGPGGGFEEFAMLNLRLCRGLTLADCRARFGPAGEEGFRRVLGRAGACPPGLLRPTPQSLSLTPAGFLVSNALLARLLD